jgi:hypothetical protein
MLMYARQDRQRLERELRIAKAEELRRAEELRSIIYDDIRSNGTRRSDSRFDRSADEILTSSYG